MTVALLVNMLYSVVDRIYLGHIPGEGRLALTGIGLAFPIIAVISAFQRLCSDGGAPLCAMARGAGELERAETIQGNAYTLLLLFSLLLIALGYAFKAPILWATGAGEATFPYADAYLRIYLVGTIFVLPSLGMNAFITGQGFPTVSMMTVLLGAVVNILVGPPLHLRIRYGGPRRCPGHGHRPVYLLFMGAALPYQPPGHPAPAS